MASSRDRAPAEQLRRQVERTLDNPEIAGSRRVAAFLRFVCDAAIEGRSALDQVEIAKVVLGRGDDFNPVDDASVRKLATAARKRLEQYYAGPGQDDPILIQLPHRSYLPHFRFREEDGAGAPVETPAPDRMRVWKPLAVIGCGLVIVAALTWRWGTTKAAQPAQFRLPVHMGDLTFQQKAPPGSVLVGPVVGIADQVRVRMVFAPQMERQEAGIMIYADPDHFVRLSRLLERRAHLQFMYEIGGTVSRPPQSTVYDPEGETGEPVWLLIRRSGDEFRAYTSSDGRSWRPIGQPLQARFGVRETRIAIFTSATAKSPNPPEAIFDQLAIGPAIPDWDGTSPAPKNPESWRVENGCGADASVTRKSDMLEVNIADGRIRCWWTLLRAAPPGDWCFSANLDSQSLSRVGAGVEIWGTRGRLRVVRTSIGGGSIIATHHPSQELARRPDYPGSPPITFRLRSDGGILTAQLSTGFERFETLPFRLKTAELGENIHFGVCAMRSAFHSDVGLAPVGIRSVFTDIFSLRNHR